MNNRKRANDEAATMAVSTASVRPPLKETSGNIPSPVLKKAKLSKTPGNFHQNSIINRPNLDQITASKAQSAPSVPTKASIAQPIGHLEQPISLKPNLVPKQPFQIHQASTVSGDKSAAAAASKNSRLVGDELRSWQASWRKIMRESVVYFDTQGCDSANANQNNELRRAQRALKQVGCDIVPFYDREVSIIVSRRPFSSAKEYPSNDIFSDAVSLKIKVWDYEKVFRFLKNLGGADSHTALTDKTTANGNLSNLLKEEKIFGSTDRDPTAKRDDIHYFDKNYLFVYDLSQNVRPIAIREWSSDNYACLNYTLDGKCPFIPDTSENLQRKKLRRAQKFEATKDYRDMLKRVTCDILSGKDELRLKSSDFAETSTSTDKREHTQEEETGETAGEGYVCSVDGQQEDNDDEIYENNDKTDTIVVETSSSSKKNATTYDFKHPPGPLLRNSSCVQPMNHSNSNSKFNDVAASGFNGASNAVQFSMDSTLNSVAQLGNGLGPTVSQVPSRNINNLKRRIFMKKQQQTSDRSDKDRDYKPGYCENCRVKYDHFDDHIVSNRHRNFACDDKNFKDIDDLISMLSESKAGGYVTYMET